MRKSCVKSERKPRGVRSHAKNEEQKIVYMRDRAVYSVRRGRREPAVQKRAGAVNELYGANRVHGAAEEGGGGPTCSGVCLWRKNPLRG